MTTASRRPTTGATATSGTTRRIPVYPTNAAPSLAKASGLLNGSVTAHVDGHLKAYYKCVWGGPGPQPAYPDHLDFLIQTQLRVSAGVSSDSGSPSGTLTASASASDSLGDSASAAYPAPANPPAQSPGGSHLVRASVDGNGVATASFSGTLDGAADNEVHYGEMQQYPNYPGYSWMQVTNGRAVATASATVSGGVKTDKRDVTISADVDPTFTKSPKLDANGVYIYDQWGNTQYQPKLNIPDNDGTMHGDVGLAVSPDHVLVPTPSDTALYVTYRANRVGGWHVGGSQDWWFASLMGVSANDMLTNPYDVSTFVIGYARPSDPSLTAYDTNGDPVYSQPTPGQVGADHIHLTYQDAAPCNGGDGATATANYYMTTHDTEESPFLFRPNEYWWQNLQLLGTVPVANFNLNPTVTVNTQDYSATTMGALSIPNGLWTLGFNAMPGWLQGVLKVAGLSDDSLKPKSTTYTVDFNGAWDNSSIDGATWSTGAKPSDSQKPFYQMTPRVQEYYERTWTRSDHYVPPGDASGYTGFVGQDDQHFEARCTEPGKVGLMGTGDFTPISLTH